MIDWASEQVLEPPCLRSLTDEELRHFEKEPLVMSVPSNSQHVERLIQLITQKGTKAASPEMRDGLCHATLNSRK